MSILIADSALDGARGNAGSIFAQFLVGLSEGMHNRAKVTARQFAEATNIGKQYAYQALLNPTEGTILTVISDWSNALNKLSTKYSDFIEVLERVFSHRRRSGLLSTRIMRDRHWEPETHTHASQTDSPRRQEDSRRKSQ